jgi:ketopantoate reductase
VIVSVRAQQLDALLPELAAKSGATPILFFGNNWWANARIRNFLSASQYLFGFSRLVGGWRTENRIECILFDAPGMVTMLGEADGKQSARLQELQELFQRAP